MTDTDITLSGDEEFDEFVTWKENYGDHMPWPDTHDILRMIEECGTDNAETRIIMLREAVKAHYEASRQGVFNDE